MDSSEQSRNPTDTAIPCSTNTDKITTPSVSTTLVEPTQKPIQTVAIIPSGSENVDAKGMAQTYFATLYPIDTLWDLIASLGNRENREFAFFFSKRGKSGGALQNSTATKEKGQCPSGQCPIRQSTEGDAEEEYVQRNRSFDTKDDLKRYITEKRPFRIEMGGLYTIRPRLSYIYPEGSSWVYLRELVFDIDINSYDGHSRSCCKDRDICPSCWPLVAIAACILDIGLANMGIEKRGWFYTGGRGMHCYVFERDYSRTTSEFRRSIVRQLVPTDRREWYRSASFGYDPVARTVISWLVPCVGSGRGGLSNTERFKRSSLSLCYFTNGIVSVPTRRRHRHSRGRGGKCKEIFGDTNDKTCQEKVVVNSVHQSDLVESDTSIDACYTEDDDQILLCHDEGYLFFDWYAVRHPVYAVQHLRDALVRYMDGSYVTEGVQPKPTEPAIARLMEIIGRAMEYAPGLSEGLTRLRTGCRECDFTIFDVDDTGDSAKRFCMTLDDIKTALLSTEYSSICCIVAEAALCAMAPVIDTNVSIQPKHLLRAPFGIHTGTLRLGVYVPTESLVKFYPTDSPRLIYASEDIRTNAQQQPRIDTAKISPRLRQMNRDIRRVTFDKPKVYEMELKRFKTFVASLSRHTDI